MAFAEEIHEIIDHAPMFERFSVQEIEAMCGFMTCHAAPRGGVLMREGEEGNFMVVILTGEVDVLRRGESGADFTDHVLPGAILGEMSLVDGLTRFATCTATAPVDFACMTRQAFNDLLVTFPRLGNKLLMLLLQLEIRRLRRCYDKPHRVEAG